MKIIEVFTVGNKKSNVQIVTKFLKKIKDLEKCAQLKDMPFTIIMFKLTVVSLNFLDHKD